jgi:SAM-dependent methyltransferase
MNHRIKPSIFGTRYFVLKQLSKAVEFAIAKYIAGDNKRNNLLDYGCGDRPYVSLFEPYIKKYIGADIAENQTADVLIEENGDIITPDESVDIVLSTQVLEHVVDVEKYLFEAHRVLNTEGLLLLSTHGYWMYHPNPTDLWRWTRDGLEKTIEKQGFEIVETLGIVGLAASGLQLFQDGIQWKIPRFLRPVLSVIILLMQKIVDNHSLTYRDAAVFLVIAKKKKIH